MISRIGFLVALGLAACSSKGHDSEPRDGGTYDGATGKSDGASPSGPSLYCGLIDSSECECGTQYYAELTAGASCKQASVPGPALCCATSTWPSAGGLIDALGCVCSQIFCVEDVEGDTCQCGFAAPDPTQGDKAVSSCTGQICCNSPSTIAPICACFTGLSACPDGQEVVPSCGPSQVTCDQQTVTSCN